MPHLEATSPSAVSRAWIGIKMEFPVRRCAISSLGFAEVCSVDQRGKSGKLELDLKMPVTDSIQCVARMILA